MHSLEGEEIAFRLDGSGPNSDVFRRPSLSVDWDPMPLTTRTIPAFLTVARRSGDHHRQPNTIERIPSLSDIEYQAIKHSH